METKKTDLNKKALLMAIPLGLVTGVITQLLIIWVADQYPPEGWPDLTIGLIIGGLGMSQVYYRRLVQGK